MNTQSDTVRYNIVAPRTLDADLRIYARNNINQYVLTAVQKQIDEDKRLAAFKAMLSLPPTFTQIDNPVAWVEELRESDEERLTRFDI